jgi:hypothetical protein
MPVPHLGWIEVWYGCDWYVRPQMMVLPNIDAFIVHAFVHIVEERGLAYEKVRVSGMSGFIR